MLYRVWQIKEHPICFQAVLANLNRHCRNVQGLVWFPTNSLHWWGGGARGRGRGRECPQNLNYHSRLGICIGNLSSKGRM